jgi:DnaJ-domain-containing protein 1
MLITLLSKFDTRKYKRQKTTKTATNTTYISSSSKSSITTNHKSLAMSNNNKNSRVDNRNDIGEWHYVLPMSEMEDYQVVLPSENEQQGQRQQQAYEGLQRNHDAAPIFAASQRNSTRNQGNTKPSLVKRMTQWRKQQLLQREQLGRSISATFANLVQEKPDQMEEESLKRAIELSMLDFALVVRDSSRNEGIAFPQINQQQRKTQQPPYEVLQVAENASPLEIKKSYRQLARLHHPDKGGDPNKFEEIARAYRSLLSSSVSGGSMDETDHHHHHHQTDSSTTTAIKSTAHWDRELQDHRRLVNELFQADGMDLSSCIQRQLSALDMLGLTFKDAGATNRNEQNEIIHNSCFYLSLATSYLWGIGALSFRNSDDEDWLDESDEELLVGETALQLKRTIEAAVVRAHPEWCLQGKVGEEVQAFSDFLVYTLDSQTLLSDWSVVVFDSESGFCDIYKGKNYDHINPAWKQANTITLRYLPGHYQALIPTNSFARRPALQDILTALDDLNLFYVVTDGNS